MVCEKCKTDSAHRSHRRGVIEFAASLFAIYPYRCAQCETRSLRFKYSETDRRKPSGTEQEIRATRRGIRWQRRKRELLLYAAALLLFVAFLYFITRDRGPSGETGAHLSPTNITRIVHTA